MLYLYKVVGFISTELLVSYRRNSGLALRLDLSWVWLLECRKFTSVISITEITVQATPLPLSHRIFDKQFIQALLWTDFISSSACCARFMTRCARTMTNERALILRKLMSLIRSIEQTTDCSQNYKSSPLHCRLYQKQIIVVVQACPIKVT